MTYINSQSGFIQWIILIIIAILILSYFGFSLRDLGEDETTQDNFVFVIEWTSVLWNDYLKAPAVWVWKNIVTFIWNDLFIANLQTLQKDKNFNDSAPESPGVEE